MNKFVVFVAGIPASGKTRFARYLSTQLHVPLLCKDMIKEKIWDKVRYGTDDREASTLFGSLAYDIAYAFAEELMMVGTSFVFESNFTTASADIVRPLVERYRYTSVTVLCDADIEVLHQRFVARDTTPERHPALRSHGSLADLGHFIEATEKFKRFRMGDHLLTVDTTDFTTVNDAEWLEKLRSILCPRTHGVMEGIR